MKTPARDRLHTAQDILFDVSAELRALAYLFETQGTKANQIAESDMDEISHGLARIIMRQVRRLHRAHSALDRF